MKMSQAGIQAGANHPQFGSIYDATGEANPFYGKT
jgi:hypothetical protein